MRAGGRLRRIHNSPGLSGLGGEQPPTAKDARRVDGALDLDKPRPVGAKDVFEPALAAAVGVGVQREAGLVGRGRAVTQLVSECARLVPLLWLLIDDDEGDDAELR